MKAYVARICFCLLTCALVHPVAGARTVEFETTEVTAADVALSPDGQTLIFTMLGHLFRLPVEGGTAEQLTFGPYYDTDPVFSPDGDRVAFVSDRDGSDGNVFVLEVATGQIKQVTHESWAARPKWAPDGQAIVYLRLLPELPGVVPTPRFSAPETVPGQVRRVALSGGKPETLSGQPRVLGSVFHLADGRLGWTVIDLEVDLDRYWWRGKVRATTRIELMNSEGTVATLRTIEGYAAPVIPGPRGHGLYVRRFRPLIPWHRRPPDKLLFVPIPEGGERMVTSLSRPRGWTPQFSVAADNKSLYLGSAGRLWKIALPSGAREPIPFNARVRLEIQGSVSPPKLAPAAGSSAPPRSILHPRLSPDGRTLIFGAAGYLWQQPLDGGPAQRLFEGTAFERDPAFSPDGRQIGFVRSEHGIDEIRVFDFESRQMRTLASGMSYWGLNWSPDGQRVVFVERDDPARRVVALNVNDGKEEVLRKIAWWSFSRPHFSPDGQSIYFSDGTPGNSQTGTLYRLPLKKKGEPKPVTHLKRRVARALVSPDGKWVAFRAKAEILVAPLDIGPVREEHVRRLSPVPPDTPGGDTFAFTPDSSAVIYSVGNRVWRHRLEGGKREEIPVRLALGRSTVPPLLLRGVRVLDFNAGGFGPQTSVLIEQGHIRWIGTEHERRLPRGTIVLEGDGRFAVPGLFDLHVHRSGVRPEAFLAYGITSVRDMGTSLGTITALADRSDATDDPLPRYFFSGDVFNARWIRGQDDARVYAGLWKEWGGEFIKVYTMEDFPPFPWPSQRAVAEQARSLGFPVVGHGTNVEEITKSVTLGYAVLEHVPSPRPYDDVLKMLAAAGTRWDPTLENYGGNTLLLRNEPERLREAKLRAFTSRAVLLWARSGGFWWSLEDRELRRQWEDQLAAVLRAHRLGVKLLAGTDAPPWGPSLHWELEHFVQAGLAPLEVLRIATQQAAEAVGAEDDLGTLEPGKLADLVLLDKNPLEDIKNTQTIWRVIKGGWVFDPEKLRPPQSADAEQ